MQPTRLGQLSEEQLDTMLARLKANLDELKNAQTLGKHNVQPFLRYADDDYDIAVNTTSAYTRKILTFTPDSEALAANDVYFMQIVAVPPTDSNVYSFYMRRLKDGSGLQRWSMTIDNQTYTNIPITNTPLTFYMKLAWIGVPGTWAIS